MTPKARGLVQFGGPPNWLEESDLAGCDFVCYVNIEYGNLKSENSQEYAQNLNKIVHL